jgi:predicted hotdog family 3-hydroxylacyl-ACP dehydratase
MCNFEDIDIRALLPQQPPFVLVDKLLYCDEVITKTEFRILPDQIFTENRIFTESGLIENIAQTCAARMGYIHRMLKNESVKTGFIGAIRNFNLFSLPKENSLIQTQIEVKSEVFNITLVDAKVTCNNELIAECEMKISE